MTAKVTIQTVHTDDGPVGDVYVDGKRVVTIGGKKEPVVNHAGKHALFDYDTLMEMDRKVKEWINENLRR